MSKNAALRWTKAGIALFACIAWRMVPFRPPNVEPVLATMMPIGKTMGPIVAFLFAVLNMVIYDLITSGFTQWTVVTALTYGVIGIGSWAYLRNRKGVIHYVIYAIIGTLIFDAITGVAAGAVLFGMSWKEGFIGQIPFTVNHLIGNTILAAILSFFVEKAFILYNIQNDQQKVTTFHRSRFWKIPRS